MDFRIEIFHEDGEDAPAFANIIPLARHPRRFLLTERIVELYAPETI